VPTGVAAGGIRIILPSQDCGPRDLPIWRVCDRKAHAEREKYVPLNRTVEVSRIAVSKEFRQRCGRKWEGEAGTTSRMVTTQLSMGLLGAVIRMCAESNMTHLTAIMEASMLRLFANFGVHLHKLGAPVEYHGLRHPVYADIDALLAQAWVERPDVWAILTDHGEWWPLNRRLAQFFAGKPAVNAGCA
jgi:N-acyl amino acid synthase of PEP-CTERM/exosortase system